MNVCVCVCVCQVSRKDFKVDRELADKTEMMVRGDDGEDGDSGEGVRRVEVEQERVKQPALSEAEAVEIAKLLISLEEGFGKPQDFEWGMEKGLLNTLHQFSIV